MYFRDALSRKVVIDGMQRQTIEEDEQGVAAESRKWAESAAHRVQARRWFISGVQMVMYKERERHAK